MTKDKRLTLFVDPQDAKELKKRAVQQGSTLSEYLVSASEYYEETAVPLTPPTNRFEVSGDILGEIAYIGEVKAGSECWRIDVRFIEADTGKPLKENRYEIWASQEYIEDYLKTLPDHSLNRKDMSEFAHKMVAKRFVENDNTLPDEYGLFCSHKTKIKKVDSREKFWNYFESFWNQSVQSVEDSLCEDCKKKIEKAEGMIWLCSKCSKLFEPKYV